MRMIDKPIKLKQVEKKFIMLIRQEEFDVNFVVLCIRDYYIKLLERNPELHRSINERIEAIDGFFIDSPFSDGG